ncbi:uncharacterized protein LOC110844093 [Folsomia candida]|nr:uncharacterized protein LOC110844093 [Folsomia candida]
MSTSSSFDHPPREHSTYVPANKTIDDGHNNAFVPVSTVAPVVGLRPDTDLKPPGEKEAPGGTNLPDDLQQALDIIYRGGGSGKPITVPPPNFPQATVPPPRLPPPMMGVPPPAGQAPYDYTAIQSAFSSSTNYYEPYQMPFDGYGASASDMEEISVAGNVPAVENPVADKHEKDKMETSSSSTLKTVAGLETGDDDDMDDLRMLGIDVDDVAVVRK